MVLNTFLFLVESIEVNVTVEVNHTSNSIVNSSGTSCGNMPVVMATKTCKAVSIPPPTNPEDLCYLIFFIWSGQS